MARSFGCQHKPGWQKCSSSIPAAVAIQCLWLSGYDTPGEEIKGANYRKSLWYYRCWIGVALHESERKRQPITQQTPSIYIQITMAQLGT